MAWLVNCIRGVGVAVEASSHASPNIRVAVVDDHRMVLEGIAARLEFQQNLSVVVCEPTWVGLLAHPEFPVDVVVLDLHLKDQISIGTKLRTLSTVGAHTVVISRHADAASIYLAIQAGAKGFVPKTETTDELVRAIESAAHGLAYQSATVRVAMSALDGVAAPPLGRQERRALMLYSAGRSIREVATAMGATDDTVKSYIKRARRKYRSAGIDLGTKVLLRSHAELEGWLPLP